MKTAIMKPGILVSLKTSLTGSVIYERRDLDTDQPVERGQSVERWETTKVVEDTNEHEKATKLRSKARSMIAKHCTPTSFGLLCPLSHESELNDAIRQARQAVDAFNRGAIRARVGVYVLKGRIAETDEEATRAIASEVRELLDSMQRGIAAADPEAIRAAANKARAMGAMLDSGTQERVKSAIAVARKAAREITKRVVKGGEDAAIVIDELQTKPIETARFAFLDLDDAQPAVEVEQAPSQARDVIAEAEQAASLAEARERYRELRAAADDAAAFEAAFRALCADPKAATPAQLIDYAERAAKGERPMPAVDVQRLSNLELN